MDMHPIFRLAVPAVTAAVLIACDRGASPAATSTATPSATTSATATASVTVSPSVIATAGRTPTAFPTGPAGPTPPAGYATSCAATYPWAKQVTKAFVCIEQPAKGASVSCGSTLIVRGYAGGSFENNVVVEVRAVDALGALAAAPLALKPMTYVAPDMGMPGFWTVELAIPAGAASNARVIAHFDSPKDGARVAEASVDVTLR